MRVLAPLLLLISLTLSAAVQAQPDSLEQLADDFWAWRGKYAPFTPDDVNRIDDSGANEGIGFYAEEMMLQAGLFDDSPDRSFVKL